MNNKIKTVIVAAFAMMITTSAAQTASKGLPTDGPLTIRPLLQQTAQRLLKGKTGSIVAIKPSTGEILCLATNSPEGENINLAIAKPYAPGSTFKTAQALTLFTEGIVNRETSVECNKGITDGNIKVGCHEHRSPLKFVDAIAHSCNTWFLMTFASMINDDFMYESKDEAINTWRDYMRSMGLGGPMGIDIPGEKGGLLANASYLNRRYKEGWDGKTIWWTGMGQGDITVTPIQLCNLAASIANRGYWYVPHIHQNTAERPLKEKYLTRRQTKCSKEAYDAVVEGMKKCVDHGTAYQIKATYPICGKTGTVENPGKDHSAFIGFAPMNDPQIAIAVYVEHGGWGADMAAPMAAVMIEMYLKGQLSQKLEAKAKKIERTATN